MAKFDELGVEIRADFSDFEKAVEDIRAKLDDTASSLAAVGARMSKGITLPLIAMATAAVAAAGAFQRANREIVVGTGESGAALEDLQQSFRDVFAAAPESAAEVAKSIAHLRKETGLTGMALEQLARTMLDVSRITGTDLNGNLDLGTKLFNLWNVEAGKQVATLDLIYRAAQATGTGFAQLLQMVVQFGPTFQQMGLSLAEAATLAGELDSQGVNLTGAMMGLKVAIAKLAQEGKPATQGLKDLFSEIKLAKDPTIAMAIAVENFGTRAGPELARAIRAGKLEIEDLVRTVEGGTNTIGRTAEETRTFSEMLGILRNRITEAVAPLGDMLISAFRKMLPLIDSVIGMVRSMADWFSKLSAPMQAFVTSLVAIVGASGPALLALAALNTALAQMSLKVIIITGGLALLGAGLAALYAKWLENSEGAEVAAASIDKATKATKQLQEEMQRKRTIEDVTKQMNAASGSAEFFAQKIKEIEDRWKAAGAAAPFGRDAEDLERYKKALEEVRNEEAMRWLQLQGLSGTMTEVKTKQEEQSLLMKIHKDDVVNAKNALADWGIQWAQIMTAAVGAAKNLATQFTSSVGTMVGRALILGDNLRDQWKQVWRQIAINAIASLVQIGLQAAIAHVLLINLAQKEVAMKIGAKTAEAGAAAAATAAPFGPPAMAAAAAAAIGQTLAISAAGFVAGKALGSTFSAAEGGIAMGPSLGLFGEAGPEVFLPLDRLDQFMGGGQKQVIQFVIDKTVVSEIAAEGMPKYLRLHGINPA